MTRPRRVAPCFNTQTVRSKKPLSCTADGGFFFSKRKVRMKVRDEGRGFDTKGHFENAGQLKQFSGSGESGRGPTLIKSFSDKVQFDQGGNTILMTLNIETPLSGKEVVASHA